MQEAGKYILGIDLGSASIGWTLVEVNAVGDGIGLVRAGRNGIPSCGAHLFEPGVAGSDADILNGKDESKAVERRTARLQRRQLRRRAARQAELFALLQERGLLPASEMEESSRRRSETRHRVLAEVDAQIEARWASREAGFAELPLYRLRRAALEQRLEREEMGRVLYHLSQRRGFLSNRKEAGKTADAKKELGKVKAGIAELQEKMEAADAPTLGAYFAGVNPHDEAQKVRRTWTARSWHREEFRQIWEAQRQFHDEVLTEELRREVDRLLYYQRPIAAQSHLVGKCELEGANHRRAPWAALIAQRFRILQKVNDLRVIEPGETESRPLNADQRLVLFQLLDCEGDMNFKAIRKALKLNPKSQFNLEKGGETRLRGNRTYKAMNEIFGSRWGEFSAADQDQIVEEWRTIETPEALERRWTERWGLEAAQAEEFAETQAEDGHCALSRKALERLMPRMMAGESFKEAGTAEYADRFSGGPMLDELPPLRVNRKVRGAVELERVLQQLRLGAIRNPAVERALSELRKLVNAIVRAYGKPYEIRVELARELKMPRQKRVQAAAKMREREKERKTAATLLLKECGITNPSRRDIEKALLHAECGGVCPYTGRTIRLADLFGEHPQFDVEHILPRSRFPDDSFQNKTLCWHEENSSKRNRTPFEAYGRDTETFEAIVNRVKSWPQKNEEKLRRFTLRSEEEIGEFTARQLNDTRYASVLACRLLESLYGGRDVDAGDGRKRQVIFANSGRVTATLRKEWKLESILGADPAREGRIQKGKSRADHRHHAVDALVIALTRQGVIQAMGRQAQRDPSPEHTARAFRGLPAPWMDFVDSVRPHIEQIVVSHRAEHKLSGELHGATLYSPPRMVNGKEVVHVRKAVDGLKPGEIASIVDPAVRAAVQQKVAERGGDLTGCKPGTDKPSGDWPVLVGKDGRITPIKRVRIARSQNVTRIGKGPQARQVAVANNHHVAIFAQLDERGNEVRWESEAVSLLEAMERKRKKLPVVRKQYGEDGEWVFKFSLMGGDTVELHRRCDHAKNVCMPEIYRLRTIASNGQLSLVLVNDARMIKEIKEAKDWWSPMADALRKLDCRKVMVDVLGRVRQAGG